MVDGFLGLVARTAQLGSILADRPEDRPLHVPAGDQAAELEASLGRAAESIRRLEVERGEQADEISRLSLLALTDDLTGLYNRRYLRDALDVAFSLACRRDLPLSVVLLDVDDFKSYNDDHGHQAGDDVLKKLAAILQGELRLHDQVARHGGEEFIVLMPGTDAPTSRDVAERLRVAIAGHDWPKRRVTASFGVATLNPSVLDATHLVDLADMALYGSKLRGRDCVTHRDDSETVSGHPSTRPDLVML